MEEDVYLSSAIVLCFQNTQELSKYHGLPLTRPPTDRAGRFKLMILRYVVQRTCFPAFCHFVIHARRIRDRTSPKGNLGNP